MSNSIRSDRRLAPLTIAIAALLVLSGCASVTPISELVNNATRYDGKTVRIAGTVQGGAGGLGVGEYQVKDNTGTLTVVSDKGSPPHSGSTVTVKGIFQALLTLGSKGLAVLREQSRSE
ncbi:MAG: hypothetical protein ABJC74_08670 [Gemmatimonadota bacterium]